ncbi:50S ribosomal protein L15 [bacterium]|nr:50S ribosomal protein L15 [bacterium]|tara:strand:+ start:33694 stop:34149 length:456 start_codon:yes stop_codon:yes gene_type:complete
MAGLHSLTRNPKSKTKRRVGRGGKRGKTSGRGHKGQKQHGGHGIRPEIRDMIKKLPKRRGYGKNRARTVHNARTTYSPINLSQLEAAFSAGDTVDPTTLVEKGLVAMRAAKAPNVKILGRGELKKNLSVKGCAVSEAAKTAIEKAGGSVAA